MLHLNPKFLAASLTALGLPSAPAFALDALRTDADVLFRQLDRDNKGYLTRADVPPDTLLSQRFDEYDRNKDGLLDRGEFASLVKGIMRSAAPMRRQRAR